MTALSLLNRQLNNFENDFETAFMNPAWIRAEEDFDFANFGLSSLMKYNEEAKAWSLTLEAAGVTKNNLKVDAKEGLLIISGEKTKGLQLGKFERDFKLPDGVDLEKVEATFEDGILTVQLPLEAKMAPKAITIK